MAEMTAKERAQVEAAGVFKQEFQRYCQLAETHAGYLEAAKWVRSLPIVEREGKKVCAVTRPLPGFEEDEALILIRTEYMDEWSPMAMLLQARTYTTAEIIEKINENPPAVNLVWWTELLQMKQSSYRPLHLSDSKTKH